MTRTLTAVAIALVVIGASVVGQTPAQRPVGPDGSAQVQVKAGC